jgi:hypothetical protein
VNHRATPRFWRAYEALPVEIRELADKNFELLKSNPSHPSLHFKKVGKFWSARVGLQYRALAVPSEGGYTWVWIGAHEAYARLIT